MAAVSNKNMSHPEFLGPYRQVMFHITCLFLLCHAEACRGIPQMLGVQDVIRQRSQAHAIDQVNHIS